MYITWENKIRQEALDSWNKNQLQLIVEAQKEFNEKLNEVNKNQLKIINDLNERNKELQSKLNEIEAYLDSDEAQTSDRSSSEVLKKTIKILRETK